MSIGLRRIGYIDNFKLSRSLSGVFIIILFLSESEVFGYTDARYLLKIIIPGEYPDPDLNP